MPRLLEAAPSHAGQMGACSGLQVLIFSTVQACSGDGLFPQIQPVVAPLVGSLGGSVAWEQYYGQAPRPFDCKKQDAAKQALPPCDASDPSSPG